MADGVRIPVEQKERVFSPGNDVTGRVIGPIVNAQRKAALLDQLASEEGVDRKQCIAIGDGANDLPMLARAGLGIAVHAKPGSCFFDVSVLVLSIAVLLLAIRVNIALAARYLRGAKGDIVARRSATIAYTRLAF